MPLVVVSERGGAQTRAVPRLRPLRRGGWRTGSGGPAGPPRVARAQAKPLERGARGGESPVADGWRARVGSAPEYRGTRAIPREAGGTTLQGYLLLATDSE